MTTAVAALPWLSDEEVASLCDGLTQPAAQSRYIAKVLKVPVRLKPNGRPLVLRAAIEGLDRPAPPPAAGAGQPRQPIKPNRAGFRLVYGGQ